MFKVARAKRVSLCLLALTYDTSLLVPATSSEYPARGAESARNGNCNELKMQAKERQKMQGIETLENMTVAQ